MEVIMGRSGIVVVGLLILFHLSEAQQLSGTYIGDGTINRSISGLGMQPDVVIVKVDAAFEAVLRSSTMVGKESKRLASEQSPKPDMITSLDSDGFTVGANPRANEAGAAYYWVAFKAKPGETAIGSYSGNGTVQTISSPGFQPDYVIVLSDDKQFAVHRSSTMSVNYTFGSGASSSNGITGFTSTGFTVGSNDQVNKSGVLAHYVAWKNVGGKIGTGSYVGDGTSDHTIPNIGFDPKYVIAQGEAATRPVHRTDSLVGDATLEFEANPNFADGIKDLMVDAFKVGGSGLTNSTGVVYHWIAFGSDTPLPVQLSSFTVQASSASTALVEWTTLSEVNNFGFYVQRKQEGGSFSDLSGVFIPGHGTTTVPQYYAHADSTIPGSGMYYYRLRQVDFDGSQHFSDPVGVLVTTLSVEEIHPMEFRLAQNFPNPFNPSTTIEYTISSSGKVLLRVFNLLGQEVARLVDREQSPGSYAIQWSAENVPAGIYFYSLKAGSSSSTRRMVLLR